MSDTHVGTPASATLNQRSSATDEFTESAMPAGVTATLPTSVAPQDAPLAAAAAAFSAAAVSYLANFLG